MRALRRLAASTYLIPIVLLIVAFAVRVIGLADQSLWYDEGYTVMLAQRDAVTIIKQVTSLDFNTPLHYLLLGFWMRAGAGTTEFAARLFFVSADMLSVALAYRFARLAGARRLAWIAAMFAGLWPVAVFFAREARMYALLSLFCMLALTQLISCLRAPRLRGWLLWALWNAAIVSTHSIGAFVVGAQLLVLSGLWVTRRTSLTGSAVLAAILSALAILTWAVLIFSLKQEFVGYFPERLDYLNWVMQGLAALIVPFGIPTLLMLPAALISAVVLIWVIARNTTHFKLLPIVIALSVQMIAAFIALLGKGSYRYTGYLGLPLAVVIGSCIARRVEAPLIATRALGWIVAALVGIGCIAGVYAIHALPQYQQEDFRSAAQYIRANATQDEQTLLVAGHFAPVYQYYAGTQGWSAMPADAVLLLGNALDYDAVTPMLNQSLEHKRGAWVLQWQDDLIDPTGVVPALLGRIAHGLAPSETITRFHGLRLLHYRFDEPFTSLPERMPVMTSSIEQSGSLRGLGALGCAQLRPPHTGDPLMEVLCFWRIKPYVALPYDMKVSLRLSDASGKQIAQSDQNLAPSRGLPYIPFEKPITSVYFIPIPAELAAGEYTLRAVPYLPGEEIAPRVVTPVRVAGR